MAHFVPPQMGERSAIPSLAPLLSLPYMRPVQRAVALAEARIRQCAFGAGEPIP